MLRKLVVFLSVMALCLLATAPAIAGSYNEMGGSMYTVGSVFGIGDLYTTGSMSQYASSDTSSGGTYLSGWGDVRGQVSAFFGAGTVSSSVGVGGGARESFWGKSAHSNVNTNTAASAYGNASASIIAGAGMYTEAH